ncbi:UNVERIFIED_CONTAM: Seipin-2 [Sesamum latifolium]|uniref:Seipin-2 n=1 Tax=Sesamum latifolium TaxID=2727402 RepID=A0AAW2TSE8_9LAMI
MEDKKSSTGNDDEEEFHDALDDFLVYDCVETLSQPIQSSGDVSISAGNHNSLTGDKALRRVGLRFRRSHSHQKSSSADSVELSKLSSLVSLENYFNSRERKRRLSRKIEEHENKLENLGSLEIRKMSESLGDVLGGGNDEKNEEHSTLTDAKDNLHEDLVRDESNLRESHHRNSSLIWILAILVMKSINFQIYLFVKFFMIPIWSVYYLYMLMFNPFGLLKRCREYLIQKVKGICNFVFETVSASVYEWLKEHQAIWKLALKCGWGLLWSGYVCAVLVGLLVSAFVMAGILIRVLVEEPVRMRRSLNFDYREKSPTAFVPMITYPELSHDIYLWENPEITKASVSRVIPPNQKLKVTVSLTLPESEYNQHLGIFQVRVDFLAADGKTIASSRRPCMLQFRSQPVRHLLTLLKIVPILTGYTSETQHLKISFRGFSEGEKPTACLRVVIEQRAEYLPGGGIPEIYAASLTLDSELPLLRKVFWSWRRTLFVWISMAIFTIELVFALVCCKPIIIPKVRMREAANGDASQNNRTGPS